VIWNFERTTKAKAVISKLARSEWELTFDNLTSGDRWEPLSSARAVTICLMLNEFGLTRKSVAKLLHKSVSAIDYHANQHEERMSSFVDENDKRRFVDKAYYDNYTHIEDKIKKHHE
jgi:hypothetical protein